MSLFARTIRFKKTTSAFEQFIIFLKGVLMGMVELIPGVGIATLSLTFNLYHEFIDFLHHISLLFKEFSAIFVGKYSKKKFTKALENVFSDFNTPLILGIMFGLAIFTFILRFTLENFPAYTHALFFGIAAASVTAPLKQLKKVTIKDKISLVSSFVLFLYLFNFHSSDIFYAPSLLKIFLSGFFSSLTLLLPGLGGSFALILFGTYSYILTLFSTMIFSTPSLAQFVSFTLFLFGIIVGFVLMVRLVKLVLKTHRSTFMASLSGIMLASLRLLYPFITVKSDIKVITTPWNLPIGHTILIFVILIVSFIVTKSLNNNVKSSDPVEDF